MTNVIIQKSNEVFLQIKAEPHIEYELRDHFTFEVEGAKFMPQYRKRNWNGEIHLYDLRSKKIYVGEPFCFVVAWDLHISITAKGCTFGDIYFLCVEDGSIYISFLQLTAASISLTISS